MLHFYGYWTTPVAQYQRYISLTYLFMKCRYIFMCLRKHRNKWLYWINCFMYMRFSLYFTAVVSTIGFILRQFGLISLSMIFLNKDYPLNIKWNIPVHTIYLVITVFVQASAVVMRPAVHQAVSHAEDVAFGQLSATGDTGKAC